MGFRAGMTLVEGMSELCKMAAAGETEAQLLGKIIKSDFLAEGFWVIELDENGNAVLNEDGSKKRLKPEEVKYDSQLTSAVLDIFNQGMAAEFGLSEKSLRYADVVKTIRMACRYAAAELGLKRPPSKPSTSFSLDLEDTISASVAKARGKYGDERFLEFVKIGASQLGYTVRDRAEAARSEQPEDAENLEPAAS